APGRPPVGCPGSDLAGARDLYAGSVPVSLDVIRGVEVDQDLGGLSGIVGRDRREVAESAARALLDHLSGALRRELARAEAAEPLLDGDRRQAASEERLGLAAGRLVARH